MHELPLFSVPQVSNYYFRLTSVTISLHRYRKFDLGDGINLIVRCEHDAVTLDTSGEQIFLNIKTLNEWDSKVDCSLNFLSQLYIAYADDMHYESLPPCSRDVILGELRGRSHPC